MQQSRDAAHTPCAVDRYRSPTEKMLLEVGDFLDAATPRMPNRHRAPRSKIHSEIRPHASLLHPIMNQKTLDRYRSPELLTAACPPRHVVLDRAAQHPRCERQTGHAAVSTLHAAVSTHSLCMRAMLRVRGAVLRLTSACSQLRRSTHASAPTPRRSSRGFEWRATRRGRSRWPLSAARRPAGRCSAEGPCPRCCLPRRGGWHTRCAESLPSATPSGSATRTCARCRASLQTSACCGERQCELFAL